MPSEAKDELPLLARGQQADIVVWAPGRVAKLFRSAEEGALAAEEARKTALVHAAGFPAPEVGDCLELDGRHGFVMERLDGPTLAQLVLAQPDQHMTLAPSFTDLQLQLAELRGQGLPPLEPRIETAIDRAPLSPSERAEVRQCLARCPSGDSIYHGDFHPLNVISTARGLFVVDWFAAARAHPAADVAKTFLTLRTATLEQLPLKPRELLLSLRPRLDELHLERYLRLSSVSRSDVRRWMRPLAAAILEAREHEGAVNRDYGMVRAIAVGELELL